MDKDKHKAELYLEYIEENVREIVVNFSGSEVHGSKELGEKGELKFKVCIFHTLW